MQQENAVNKAFLPVFSGFCGLFPCHFPVQIKTPHIKKGILSPPGEKYAFMAYCTVVIQIFNKPFSLLLPFPRFCAYYRLLQPPGLQELLWPSMVVIVIPARIFRSYRARYCYTDFITQYIIRQYYCFPSVTVPSARFSSRTASAMSLPVPKSETPAT